MTRKEEMKMRVGSRVGEKRTSIAALTLVLMMF